MARKCFTQLCEEASVLLGDITATTENKAKAWINMIYTRGLAGRRPPWLRPRQATFDAVDDYTTGTASVTNGSATVTGTSTVWTAAMVGRLFKVTGNDEVYRISARASNTSITIDHTYTGTTNATATYTIAQDRYSLGSTVGKVERVWYHSDGVPKVLEEISDAEWFNEHQNLLNLNGKQFEPGTPAKYRILSTDTSDDWELLLSPPSDADRVMFYEYFRRLLELMEYTSGTVVVTRGSATVTGTGTRWNTASYVSAGDLFRIDSETAGGFDRGRSRWYEVSSVASDTSLTLTENYDEATASTQTYTISEVPLVSEEWQDLLLWGACYLGATSQGDRGGAEAWLALYVSGINDALKDELAKTPSYVGGRVRSVSESLQYRRTY